MKMVKSLLLGSAAGLVAIAGAQAADLPVKAKPVQYVKICSLYGVGFYYIPGTDMCLKVGGWARFETSSGYAGSFTTGPWFNNYGNRTTVGWHTRVKGTATFDARSSTEYGTVRSYIAIGISTNNTGDNPISAGYANRWFIQWAGFTIGHSTSFFDFYSIGANQYGLTTASSDSGDGGWDVFAYTAQFGNGLSATLSAEMARRTQIVNANTGVTIAGLGGNVTSRNYEALQQPDVVANLRIDQAWGSAQIMGAWHEVQSMYYGSTEDTGHPSDKAGFALGAGIKLNVPMIGKGDYLQVQGTYTVGATRYANMTAFAWNYQKWEGQNMGFGIQSDAVYGGTVAGNNASDLELTTAWAVNAAYKHHWNAAWTSTLWGSYFEQNYSSGGNAMICSAAGDGVGAGTLAVANAGCNMDWSIWGVGLRTDWAVSKTFQLGLEVFYGKLITAQSSTGTVLSTAVSGKPSSAVVGPYTLGDMDNWAVRFRVNRPFYP